MNTPIAGTEPENIFLLKETDTMDPTAVMEQAAKLAEQQQADRETRITAFCYRMANAKDGEEISPEEVVAFAMAANIPLDKLHARILWGCDRVRARATYDQLSARRKLASEANRKHNEEIKRYADEQAANRKLHEETLGTLYSALLKANRGVEECEKARRKLMDTAAKFLRDREQTLCNERMGLGYERERVDSARRENAAVTEQSQDRIDGMSAGDVRIERLREKAERSGRMAQQGAEQVAAFDSQLQRIEDELTQTEGERMEP